MITERYPAVVTAVDEMEMVGGIKVACVGLLGDEETELPMVVPPAFDWGWFYIPDVGEVVEIEVVVSSEEDEIFGQASIDNLNIVWRNKRFYTDDKVDPNNEVRKIHNDFIAEAYGKRRGFATPFGHVFMFDDTESSPRIWLTWMKEQLEQGKTPQPEKYSRVEIEPDGSFKIGLLNKHHLHLQTEGKLLEVSLDEGEHILRLEASTPKLDVRLANGDHNITLDGDQFTANLGGGATLKCELKDANAKLTLGDGTKHATIVEHLQTLYEGLKAKLDGSDTHSHATGMGASGPPVPTITADPWDNAINSTKVSIPDG